MLVVLSFTLWVLAAWLFSCLCHVRYLIIVFSGSWHYGHLVGDKGAGFFTFLWSVAYVLSVMVCLLFLSVSLVGYNL